MDEPAQQIILLIEEFRLLVLIRREPGYAKVTGLAARWPVELQFDQKHPGTRIL